MAICRCSEGVSAGLLKIYNLCFPFHDDDSDTHNLYICRVMLSPRSVCLKRYVMDDIPNLKGFKFPLLVHFLGLNLED